MYWGSDLPYVYPTSVIPTQSLARGSAICIYYLRDPDPELGLGGAICISYPRDPDPELGEG